jgi:hypothetical protein
MALWARASVHPGTRSEMEDAARERFWDGIALACNEQRETGAVYQWGYVAEMLLKCACLRVRGIAGNANVVPFLQSYGMKHHRLSDLLDDLRIARIMAARPFDPVLDGALRAHVDTLSQNWDVLLRYRSVRATETELSEVYASVDWLILNYALLS